MINFLVANDDLPQLRAQLTAAPAGRRLGLLVALAWQLRQRNSSEALLRMNEALGELRNLPLPDADAAFWRARLRLVQAEVLGLRGELAQAQGLADRALALFSEIKDAAGMSDALALSATLAANRGEPQLADQLLQRAVAPLPGGPAPDLVRQQVVRARRILDMALVDLNQALPWLQAWPHHAQVDAHPAVAAWLEGARAMTLALQSRLSESLPGFIRSFHAALDSGQQATAILAAGNVGVTFANLNDWASALEWHERAGDLARQNAWGPSIGAATCDMACALAASGQVQAALQMHLQSDALQMPGSFNQAKNWLGLGEAFLALGEGAEANGWLEKAEQHFRQRKLSQGLTEALQTRAKALLHLGDRQEARALALQALATVRQEQRRYAEVQVLCQLARICDPADQHQGGPTALAYLQEALALARSMEGYTPPVELLEALAAEHARRGEFSRAYELSVETAAAQAQIQSQAFSNRAAALNVRHETDRLRLEADHHRQLVLQEQQRANELAQANRTLEHIGRIGRDITAGRDAAAVCCTIGGHVREVLDAQALAVHRLGDDQRTLVMMFGVENGRAVAAQSVDLHHPHSLLARCARERVEVVDEIEGPDEGAVPQSADTCSVMMAPLVLGGRLLGVITVQSQLPQAYTDRERAVFRTLCAYGAIALGNADAQAQLRYKNQTLEGLATTDLLTGLHNRRSLDAAMRGALSTAKRHHTSFALILLDVDHFKGVNDRFGHPVGDAVLAGIGRILKERGRVTDVAGRWGGEEFLLVCANTGQDEAMVVAESIRSLIEACEFPVAGRCTASLGVAAYRPGDTIATLETRADQALYAAKAGGRNQVCSAGQLAACQLASA